MTEPQIAIIDNGSGSIKCGFAGDNLPRAVFSTLVGPPLLRSGGGRVGASAPVIGAEVTANSSQQQQHKELKKIMVGDETVGVRHLLDLSMPLKNGTVQKPD